MTATVRVLSSSRGVHDAAAAAHDGYYDGNGNAAGDDAGTMVMVLMMLMMIMGVMEMTVIDPDDSDVE